LKYNKSQNAIKDKDEIIKKLNNNVNDLNTSMINISNITNNKLLLKRQSRNEKEQLNNKEKNSLSIINHKKNITKDNLLKKPTIPSNSKK